MCDSVLYVHSRLVLYYIIHFILYLYFHTCVKCISCCVHRSVHKNLCTHAYMITYKVTTITLACIIPCKSTSQPQAQCKIMIVKQARIKHSYYSTLHFGIHLLHTQLKDTGSRNLNEIPHA